MITLVRTTASVRRLWDRFRRARAWGRRDRRQDPSPHRRQQCDAGRPGARETRRHALLGRRLSRALELRILPCLRRLGLQQARRRAARPDRPCGRCELRHPQRRLARCHRRDLLPGGPRARRKPRSDARQRQRGALRRQLVPDRLLPARRRSKRAELHPPVAWAGARSVSHYSRCSVRQSLSPASASSASCSSSPGSSGRASPSRAASPHLRERSRSRTARNPSTPSGSGGDHAVGSSRMSGRGERSLQDLLDHGRLRIRIVLHVLPLPGAEPALRPRVELSVRFVCAQPIAEDEHPLELGALRWKNVQVHRRGVVPPQHPVLEPVRLANAEDVPRRLQLRDVRLLVGRVGDDEVDVDARSWARAPKTEVEPT